MLNLQRKDSAHRGGESGAAIIPGDLENSLLWQRIAAGEMPPESSLDPRQQESIRQWIVGGAIWGTDAIDPFQYSTSARAGYDWWSLQPIERPITDRDNNSLAPVDQFVNSRLQQVGLSMSPRAPPRELIRRLHFDLIGLPPTPSEVRDFQAAMLRDSDRAIRTLVDRLLDSRHYGERWSRHWLDVVRFGESQGFERDKLRDNLWHYRDWVIEALNADMPYNEFIRQQLAGDLLYPDKLDAIIATGFLVAGPWDEVGQSMQSKAMRAVVRQDEIEDYVGTVGQVFLGLTVNCARCHDHKFDPIRQEEYYRIASALDGVRHGSRSFTSAEQRAKIRELDGQIREADRQIATIENRVRLRLVKASLVPVNDSVLASLQHFVRPISRWDFEIDLRDSIGDAHATKNTAATVEDGQLILNGNQGYAVSAPINRTLREKTLEAWVKIDNDQQRGGAAISIQGTKKGTFDAIVFGEKEPGRWMAGSDSFRRTKSFAAPIETQATGQPVHIAIVYRSDGMILCYRNGARYGTPYKADSPITFAANQWQVQFGLRCCGPAPSRQLSGRLEVAQLYDRALTAQQVLASYESEKAGVAHGAILAELTAQEKEQHAAWSAKLAQAKQQRHTITPTSVYVARPAKAGVAHVLLRGNPAQASHRVSPGGIASISGVPADFGLPPDAPDSQRRRKLAEWITNPNNPLTRRVIVNRLWHYHFGSGLVRTPNDFGFSGGNPSHPKLLDYLASELLDSGWSLKHIHRLIVTSDAYLQSSRGREECAEIDAENRLLWRKRPTRLDAEVLRDSILMVSGQLNLQFGGAPYRDFKTFVNNSQFYETVDLDDPDVYRRTIYRTWIRSGRNQLLDVFDCPDPSTTTPRRSMTTTPLQALTLMNNSFVLRMADRFAQRAVNETSSDILEQVRRVAYLAYGRLPNDSELELASRFVEDHGLPAYCRVILNSNEFIHVD